MLPLAVRYALGFPVLAAKRRLLTQFRRDLGNAAAVQARRLQAVLAACSGSAFARDHGLGGVRTAADLAAALPIAGFDRMAPYVARVMAGEVTALFRPGTDVLMFATTSGTTAAAKHIPVTRASLAEYRESWTIWGCALAEAHPRLPYAGVVNLASPWRAEAAPSGVPCGSITGLLFESMHRTLRVTNAVPPAVALVTDPGARQYLALRLALARPDVMMLTTANPSTLLGFARRMALDADALLADVHDGGVRGLGGDALPVLRALRPYLRPAPRLARQIAARAAKAGALRPRVAWPQLELLGVWTGGTLSPYLQQLPAFFGDIALRDHGLSASEGRLTIPLADGVAFGPLNVRGAFCEFVPEGDYGNAGARTYGAHELEVGARYYVVLTTTGGLVRYDLADLVECAGHLAAAPLLRFLNKGREIANITGEKLSAYQVTEGLVRVQAELGMSLGECTVAPAFGDPPCYHLLIEAAVFPEPATADRIAVALERQLMALNVEYADKRRSGRLGPLALTAAADGTFAALRTARLAGGAAAEQYKHGFLVTDHAFVGRVRSVRGALRSG